MVAAVHRGTENSYQNEAAVFLYEWNQRTRLAKMGYRFDPATLSAVKAEVFAIIGQEFEELRSRDLKKKG